MKKFFGEFKKFITRGNVLDMAVGVIVGGAFTGIVNGLSNYILKPLINALLAVILGSEGLEGAITMLSWGGSLEESIYIDWGAFISSIINFLLIAITLFTIVRIINRVRENNGKMLDGLKKVTLNKSERKELKAAGVCIKDRDAVKAYFAKKEEDAKLKAEEEAKKAELEAEEAKLHSTEGLLEQIKALLEKQLAPEVVEEETSEEAEEVSEETESNEETIEEVKE